MRILFLSSWSPWPPNNGSKIRASYLLQALQRSHETSTVAFCPTDKEVPGAEWENFYAVRVDPFRYVNLPKLLKYISPIPLACWPSQLMRQTVKRIADLGHWDAVVAFQSSVAQYALLLPNVPRVLDVDTAYSYQAYERHINQSGFVGRLRTWVSWRKTHRYEARLFRRYQTCTVVSSTELSYVGRMVRPTNGRCELVPNGVDCQHNHLGIARPEANRLVYNGALTYSANFQAMQYFLGEIYPQIKKQVPGVSLTITGSTKGVDLSGLHLDESVRLSGYVDDIRPVVAGAWICIAPLLEGGGTRLKILEAMALGTPVVSTSKGAEGLEVTPDREILIADEPAAFAAAVIRLLRDAPGGDSSARQQLVTNARCLVEQRYDWGEIGRRFVDLVEEVTHRRAYTR